MTKKKDLVQFAHEASLQLTLTRGQTKDDLQL